jgi:ABC-type nitrate/sulfonate/bicarbonate transport system permease component
MKPSTSRSPSNRWLRAGAGLLSVVILIAVWEGASRSFPSVILPSLGETLQALGWLLHRDSFYDHAQLTLTRSVTGFSLSRL